MKRASLWFVLLALGCEDPVLEERADSLGPDRGTYPEGPLHRAGDPCTWCHDDDGRADPELDLAGTVYETMDSELGMQGVTVRLFDRNGQQQTLVSNAAGNFFLHEGELSLEFPLWVKLEYQDRVAVMRTPIFRERSCAVCHRRTTGTGSAGRVSLEEPP